MTLQQLRTFAAVARHLNLRKAAAELHISQPSVSARLRLLEEEFGKKFYTKSGRGIELTEKGRLFLKDAEAALLQVDRLREKFVDNRFGETETGSLAVGGTYGPSAILLPSVLAVFKRKHPKVQINLLTASGRNIETKVVEGDVDIAVVSSVDPPPRFNSEPYGTMKSVAFVASDHPIAKKKELSLNDLRKTPLIIRGGRPGIRSITEIVLDQLSDLGFKPNIAMRCDSSDALKMAVKKKLGVGILYEDVVRDGVRRGEFKIIKLPGLKMDGNLFIIYPRDKPLSTHARNFLTLLHHWRRRHSH